MYNDDKTVYLSKINDLVQAAKLNNVLRREGFTPASPNGVKVSEIYEMCEVGLLYRDPDHKRRLFGLIKPKRRFIGVINLPHAYSSNEIHIKVYGREYQDLLNELRHKLELDLDIPCKTELCREYSAEEILSP